MKRLLTLAASFVVAGSLGYLAVNAWARHWLDRIDCNPTEGELQW